MNKEEYIINKLEEGWVYSKDKNDNKINYKIYDEFDITKNYVYVLELNNNKYYVGRSKQIIKRITDHFNNKGSKYTRKNKPINIISIIEESNKFDEKNKTLEIMKKYGYENVRGYAWCSNILRGPPKDLNNKTLEEISKRIENNKNYADIITYNNMITYNNIIKIRNYDKFLKNIHIANKIIQLENIDDKD